MILKIDAFLGDPAQLGERENLEPAAIGQDRSVPAHKSMQSAEMPNHLKTWPNEQMIGISENNLRSDLAKLARAHCFHASLSADRHEGRGFDHAMCGR